MRFTEVKGMKRLATVGLVTTIVSLFAAWVGARDKPAPARPKILGIAGLHFYTSDLPGARIFYSHILGQDLECRMCEEHAADPILVRLPSQQFLTFTPIERPTENFLAAVTFATDDVKGLRESLKAHGVAVESGSPIAGILKLPGWGGLDLNSGKQKDSNCALCGFTVTDPDGHRLGFIQPGKLWASSNTDALRIIHAGFIVKDRAAEDHFYRDILGFHLYWHGGMKDEVDNWVAMQVPDGTDWVEYMLQVPADASKHTRGVMNHMALGVVDIHATQKQIVANGAQPKEEPKVGRDGKWQLNLYDPDETRTEFMEFTPKEKPCCSEFNGTHPGPK
jgi:catechol 2,3-dioxygenase-like lactoylglutathione lyase family enzyme